MKANTAIGIAGAFVVLGVAVILEGGNPASFINIPAFLIVVGGTGMAVLASTSIETVKRIPALYKQAIAGSTLHPHVVARQMIALAEKARREGLLALENDIEQLDDHYTRKGIQLVVDGADSDLVAAVLMSETDAMAGRHYENAHVFTLAGGFAPTLGILGTVMSLVHVLENLDKPSTLGHSIAGAFLATLFGVGSANLLFLPVANRLKELSREELRYREMLLEAVLAIQAGDNPRILAEKLESFVAPAARGKANEAPTRAGAPEALVEAPA
jgi:chemotaxis protein MotA